MIVWPPRLVQEVARRRCVVFIGAGVSRQSVDPHGNRPPMWGQFLDAAVARVVGGSNEIKRFLKKSDYLTACHLIKTRLGDHDWHDLLEEKFSRPHYGSGPIHEHIFSLDSPIVATTNVDKIYERFATNKYPGAVVCKNYSDNDIGRYIKGDATTRLVVKVHGSVDNLDGTVFTRLQYANARVAFPNFYEILSALIMTKTFIFLGYSLADPDIQLILENNARQFRAEAPHYFVTSDRVSREMVQFFETNYNIKIISYSGKDEHKELTDSLATLVADASVARADMAANQIW